MRSHNTTLRPPRMLWLMATTFGGFFLLGYGGIMLWNGPPGTASPIWPATAFGLVMILRLARNRAEDIAFMAAMLAAGLLANGLGGAPPVINLGFSLINVLDVALGIVLVRRIGRPHLGNMHAVTRFILAVAILPSLAGAALSAALVSWQGQSHVWQSAGQWLAADILGVVILFPLGLTVSLRQFTKLKLHNRFFEAAVVFSILATLAYFGFRHRAPVLYLAMAATLAAGVRFRLMGAGASLIVISAIGFAALQASPDSNTFAQMEFLQVYLAVCSIVSVRAAMLLNERDLHVAVIERQRRRAVRASRFKSQLLAHVSHEVRSPLSAIIGFSSMLESGTLQAARAPEFAAIIAHNGELLQRLHDDLLDMSRAEAGTLALQARPVSVAQTLQNCVNAIRLDATLGGKSVVIDPVAETLALNCDPVRLAQILNNLIANAFKYGDNLSPIHVRAQALEDGFGRIEITNSGPGIPISEREAVFAPFRRSVQVGRDVPGAGLGLSIAKLLVEAQGGRINFESVPGRQTRFWVDLPITA